MTTTAPRPVFEVPYSEEAFIGSLLISPSALAEVRDYLSPCDLLSPKMSIIYESMLDLWATGITPVPEVLADHLRANGHMPEDGTRIQRGDLVALMANTGSTRPMRYVPVLRDNAFRRRAVIAARTAVEVLSDRETPTADALEAARSLLADVESSIDTPNELVPVGEFVRGDDSYDWLVPWLIERGERMLVVAGESGGKSMLLRMLAVCSAWGIQPFNGLPMAPLRVVMLDLENPPNLIRRKLRPMVAKARELRPQGDDTMMSMLCRPGGIDVAKVSDARWLSKQLELAKPELVVAGPLYKMFNADDKWEAGAREVTRVLDDLRTRMGFSLILETHAPQSYGGKRDLRPIGSSIWLRWPEFVLSFAALDRFPDTVKLTTLKGRDERHWPHFMERGGQWPWTPCRDPEAPKGQPDPEPPPPENVGPHFDQGAAF